VEAYDRSFYGRFKQIHKELMEVGKFESVEHDQVNWMQDGFEIFER
jgi:hypothetical protein